jgi:hypothetical protein
MSNCSGNTPRGHMYGFAPYGSAAAAAFTTRLALVRHGMKGQTESSPVGCLPHMEGFYDALKAIGSHLRAKEFAAAERVFEQFIAKSRREALNPTKARKLEHFTSLYDVVEERIAFALEHAGYMTLGSVAAATDQQLLLVPHIGRAALEAIRAVAPRPEHKPIHEMLADK